MTLRAVLFDMDGTLVDTETLWWTTVAAIAEELGYQLSSADEPSVTGASVEDTARYLASVTTAPSPVLVRRLDDAFCHAVSTDIELRPGALRLLDELAAAAVPLALVSASPRRVVSQVLRTVGADRFEVTVAAGESPRNKPHPDPYLTALEMLGSTADDCVAVEDSPTGVASAEGAGCRVLAVPSVLPIAAAPGRVVRSSLAEIDVDMLREMVRHVVGS